MQCLVSKGSRLVGAVRHEAMVPSSRLVVATAAKKGFGSSIKPAKADSPTQQPVSEEPSTGSDPAASTGTAAPADDKEAQIEAMLSRRKNRGRVEPKVKVQSAAVDMATGKAPTSPVGEAETRVVQALGIFFFILLAEGLLLAGSGFLPTEWDPFFKDVLYPSYSPQMLLFLGMSSAYGLWKTGKLPGQQQIK